MMAMTILDPFCGATRIATMKPGRHFLHIPGPSNVPDRVLRAIDRPTIDHRGPEFRALGREVLTGLRRVFKTAHPVVIFPASGTGAWEAALCNTLSPGDRVLFFDCGFFSGKWEGVAEQLGLRPERIEGDWRAPIRIDALAQRLADDPMKEIRAVAVVHNETSTGVTHPVARVRQALDKAAHPALLMVDAVSSLGSIDYRHDEWSVDVAIAASQKGLMLPPGLSFNALSPKALEARTRAKCPRAYWDWGPQLEANEEGFFPYTPSTNLLYGLREALAMLEEEGLAAVFARHTRLATGARAAFEAWGLEFYGTDPDSRSSVVTAFVMPEGFDGDTLRKTVLERYDLSLGGGLGRLRGRVVRLGHLGSLNEMMLAGALAGIELGLGDLGIPMKASGVAAAVAALRTALAPAHA